MFRTGCPLPLLALAIGLALGLPLAAGALSDDKTAADIETCMQENFPSDSSIQSIVMVSNDRVGNANEMRSKIFWQKGDEDQSKVLMLFDDPPDLRGAALLMLEKPSRSDMFMYLPELGKTRRVTSHMMSSSMFGTDFSYEQFERMQGMADDATSERQPDADVEGRPVYVIANVPGPESDSEFDRVVSYVDRETCVMLKVEFFEKGDELTKVMTSPFGTVTQEPSGWVPRQINMKNLIEGTDTTIEVTEIETGAEIPRKYFSQSKLSSLGR